MASNSKQVLLELSDKPVDIVISGNRGIKVNTLAQFDYGDSAEASLSVVEGNKSYDVITESNVTVYTYGDWVKALKHKESESILLDMEDVETRIYFNMVIKNFTGRLEYRVSDEEDAILYLPPDLEVESIEDVVQRLHEEGVYTQDVCECGFFD